MNHVLGRLHRQLIQGSPKWQFPTSCCRPDTRFAPAAFRPGIFARAPWRTLSTAKPDETKPEAKVKKLDQKLLDEWGQEVKVRQSQVKRPWHREGADNPPVEKRGGDLAPVTEGWCGQPRSTF